MGAPGFDDAPMAKLKTAFPKYVGLVYPYYENPKFLEVQLRGWLALPQPIRDLLSVVVVDDGSPRNPAEPVLRGTRTQLDIRLFRISCDVRWNWLAARNIGMRFTRQVWNVLTDMDHVVTKDVLCNLIEQNHSESVIYRFSRREHTGEPVHPHPNSMFMTREMFWKVGGYDENLSGCYGTDGDWRRRCAATAKVLTLPDALVRHEFVGDSSTTDYLRKQPEDARKKAIIAARQFGWRPKTLSFPFFEVQL